MRATQLPVADAASGAAEHAIVRCLSGPEPEHRARALIAGVLAQVGLGGELPDAEQAISELVTNAYQHAPGPYELRILMTSAAVKIAVMDGGADHAELALRLAQAATGVPGEDERGRGLQIVSGLFPGRCGAEPSATCTGLAPAKQAWITMPRPGRAAAGSQGRPVRSVRGRGRCRDDERAAG